MDLYSKGYFLEVTEGPAATSPYDHQFCGAPKIPGAACPLCGRALLRFFSLDLRDPFVRDLLSGDGWSDIPFLHLLYCWRCGDVMTYTLRPGSGVAVLKGPLTGEGPDYPYERYPDVFPQKRVALKPIPPEVQETLRRGNKDDFEGDNDCLVIPRHQLGGEPYLTQSGVLRSDEKCQECGRKTALLASVGNDNGTPKGFAGDEFVQVVFFLCAPCKTLDAYNMCD